MPEVATSLPEPAPSLSSVTVQDHLRGKSGGITVTSNSETEEQVKENFEALEKPKDGEPPDPELEAKEKVKRAASELGKKGAEARAAKALEVEEAEEERVAEEAKRKADEEIKKAPADKRKELASERIKEATRKEAEAKRAVEKERARAEAAEREAAELKARLQAPARPPEVSQTARPAQPGPEAYQMPPKPQPGQFQTTDDWLDARDEWNRELVRRQITQENAQKEEVRKYTEWVDRELGEAVQHRKDYAKSQGMSEKDFLEQLSPEVNELKNKLSIARDMQEPLGPDHVIADQIVLAKGAGPGLLVYLSEHPDELQRLRALRTPTEVQVEMRVLARSLSTAATTEHSAAKGEVSKAKPPVRPVAGQPHVGDEELSDDMSDDEYIRKAEKKEPWQRRSRSRR